MRLALLAAQGCNFLLLDEPINHLDIPARESFERAMARFSGTVLAVVHDRYFIDRFATTVWVLEDGRISTWPREWWGLSKFVTRHPSRLALHFAHAAWHTCVV